MCIHVGIFLWLWTRLDASMNSFVNIRFWILLLSHLSLLFHYSNLFPEVFLLIFPCARELAWPGKRVLSDWILQDLAQEWRKQGLVLLELIFSTLLFLSPLVQSKYAFVYPGHWEFISVYQRKHTCVRCDNSFQLCYMFCSKPLLVTTSDTLHLGWYVGMDSIPNQFCHLLYFYGTHRMCLLVGLGKYYSILFLAAPLNECEKI